MKTIIHVNNHKIRENKVNGTDLPVITCKTYKSNDYCKEVEILDANGEVAAKVVYRPDKPRSCGATVWVETDYGINIIK